MSSESVPVHVQGVPLCKAYPAGTTNVCIPVLLEVDMPEPVTYERKPCELCIVLDKSGSMGGAKMRAATAAVHSIIDALSENDVMHLVTYDQQANTVLQNVTRANASDAHAIVSSITANGLTNIEGGLRRAEEVLSNSGERDGVKRIFLLSDGCASCGFRSVEDLKRLSAEVRDGGVIISTFGIGQDFDEQVMKAMAFSGRGSYFFLRESVIRQTIEDAMSSLQLTVGVSATIHVESLPPFGQLTRIFRPLDSEEDNASGTTGEFMHQAAHVNQTSTGIVWVGDLQAGSHKQQLIEARLHLPLGLSLGDEVELLRYECRFLQPGTGMEVRVPGTISVVVGDCGAQMPQVQVAHVMQELEPRQEEFTQLMDGGNREQAIALQLQIIRELEAVQELDARGYVAAQVRRLRRVVERVRDNLVSITQARLMVGEALQRANSGNLFGLNSPPGTPTVSFRRPSFHQDESFGDLTRLRTYPTFLRRPRIVDGQCAGCFSWLRRFTQWRTSRTSELPIDFSSSHLAFDEPLTPQPWTLSPVSVGPLEDPPLLSEPVHLLSNKFDLSCLPSELLCPITHEVMTDPVVAHDGHTYERLAIERWFREGNRTSPKTGEQMLAISLIPNHSMRAQIMSANDSAAACDACEALHRNRLTQ